MKPILIVAALYFAFSCLSCGKKAIPDEMLHGTWKVSALVAGKDTSQMDFSGIYFKFNKNNRYFFQSSLNQKEAGRYYTQGYRLLTTDTLKSPEKEKSVMIESIDADSMTYIMNLGGQRQAMYLYKVK